MPIVWKWQKAHPIVWLSRESRPCLQVSATAPRIDFRTSLHSTRDLTSKSRALSKIRMHSFLARLVKAQHSLHIPGQHWLGSKTVLESNETRKRELQSEMGSLPDIKKPTGAESCNEMLFSRRKQLRPNIDGGWVFSKAHGECNTACWTCSLLSHWICTWVAIVSTGSGVLKTWDTTNTLPRFKSPTPLSPCHSTKLQRWKDLLTFFILNCGFDWTCPNLFAHPSSFDRINLKALQFCRNTSAAAAEAMDLPAIQSIKHLPKLTEAHLDQTRMGRCVLISRVCSGKHLFDGYLRSNSCLGHLRTTACS